MIERAHASARETEYVLRRSPGVIERDYYPLGTYPHRGHPRPSPQPEGPLLEAIRGGVGGVHPNKQTNRCNTQQLQH